MPVRGQEAGLAQLITQLHLLGGTASRAELTERLGCGRSVTGYLLGDLVRRGVVAIDRSAPGATTDGGTADGGTVGGRTVAGGRPSHRVRVAPTAPTAIGIHLESGRATVATFALGGTIMRGESFALERSWRTSELIGRLADLVTAQARGRRVLGVGMAVPSPVRRQDGRAFAMLHLGWPDVPFGTLLGELLAARLGSVPLSVGNDANLAALAEHRRGAGRDCRQLLYLTTGLVGLGGALISGGRLFDGAHGYAMEPGHITVDPAGVPCLCGSTGCLEVECDHRGLLRAAGRSAVGSVVGAAHGSRGGPAGPRDVQDAAAAVLDAAAAGDGRELAAVRHVTRRLGIGLASLINLTDPDRVVLGGSLARYARLAPGTLTDSLAERSFLSMADPVPVTPAELPDAALRGAADAAFQPLLDDPRATLDRLPGLVHPGPLDSRADEHRHADRLGTDCAD